MAGQYPSMGYVADSQTVLLRKICNNTAQIVDTGGGGGGAVTKIIAGSNITIDPVTGLGAVTINATGGSGGGNDYAAIANNAGDTTITPTEPNYTAKLTFGGSAGSRIIILDTAGRSAGDKIFLDLVLPATTGIIIYVRNATSGGVLLLPVESFPSHSITTDGNIASAHWEFTYTGTAWTYDTSNIPA